MEGKHALVVGTGTIGLLTLACVVAQKPAGVTVADLCDTRLGVVRQMGATPMVNPDRDNLARTVASLTQEKGMDVSIEAVGANPAVRQAYAADDHSGVDNLRHLPVQPGRIRRGDAACQRARIERRAAHQPHRIHGKGTDVFQEMARSAGDTIKCVLLQKD